MVDRRPWRRTADAVGLALTSGFTILAGFFIGYYGGQWLDRLAGTGPWLTLVGMVLGFVAGLRVLIRDILGSGPPNAGGEDRRGRDSYGPGEDSESHGE